MPVRSRRSSLPSVALHDPDRSPRRHPSARAVVHRHRSRGPGLQRQGAGVRAARSSALRLTCGALPPASGTPLFRRSATSDTATLSASCGHCIVWLRPWVGASRGQRRAAPALVKTTQMDVVGNEVGTCVLRSIRKAIEAKMGSPSGVSGCLPRSVESARNPPHTRTCRNHSVLDRVVVPGQRFARRQAAGGRHALRGLIILRSQVRALPAPPPYEAAWIGVDERANGTATRRTGWTSRS